jgi:NADPH-dependent 2,4-dienoyl-CoA reductase/sulfur reductase-like enzyme/nitrite reductase/ring-hydroxylating ferredoxin subunit
MSQHEIEVAALKAVEQGGMKQVEVDGEKILLLRDGDAVRAVGATCPHAGGPLVQGVRNGGRIICPWHKAAFCIRTGAVQDPPALDALPCYDVRVEAGRILLTPAPAPAPAPAAPPAVSDGRCFVIVGAGGAGAMAAQTLREEGFKGRVVMLDPANRVPYDRTVLSKYALSGQKGAEKSPLQTQCFYREHRIERRTAEVSRIDAQARRITCADGTVMDYDAALLATGAAPVMPSLPGAGLDHVYTLRSRADADAIVAQAERSTCAVVLGASFIGMEVAASLRERGLDVTVVGKEAAPFAKQLGEQVGRAFVGLHEGHGVAFRLGRGVASLEGNGQVSGVVLEGGERIAADLVVAGFGVKPATAYAEGLNRSDDGGLLVDAALRVSPGLYAAGDIARFPHRGDGEPIRVEHWRVAEQHGRVAALNMLGRDARYDAVPFFWTIQYMKRLDYVGHAAAWDSTVLHGDLGKPEFLVYYVKDGRVAAAAGMGRDQDTAALIELFARRRDWQAEEFGEHPAAVLAAL